MLDYGFYNMDCMEGMREFPDKYFEFAFVDPPYGIGAAQYTRGGTQYGKAKAQSKSYGLKDWDKSKPTTEYFNELFRVSKNQIIWGGNYMTTEINKDSSCWIVWDKVTGNNCYADCELAWTSFGGTVRMFRFQWMGMLQGDMKDKELRIHPTQKPVKLYEWILNRYAHEGDKILDTHVGSASSLIACHRTRHKFVGFEIDKEYYTLASERLKAEQAQMTVWDYLEDNK